MLLVQLDYPIRQTWSYLCLPFRRSNKHHYRDCSLIDSYCGASKSFDPQIPLPGLPAYVMKLICDTASRQKNVWTCTFQYTPSGIPLPFPSQKCLYVWPCTCVRGPHSHIIRPSIRQSHHSIDSANSWLGMRYSGPGRVLASESSGRDWVCRLCLSWRHSASASSSKTALLVPWLAFRSQRATKRLFQWR